MNTGLENEVVDGQALSLFRVEFVVGMLVMEKLLRQLLNRLDDIGSKHEEIYDSECRERLSSAVMEGFVRAKGANVLDQDFGLSSEEASRAVREALMEYIDAANGEATKRQLTTFPERLAAFQNPNVASDRERNYFDDFFGYSDPSGFDAAGNVIHTP